MSTTKLKLRPGTEYRVLSVKQPWAWAIIHGGKDVENRSWHTRHRGPLLIHASGSPARWALDHNVALTAEYLGMDAAEIHAGIVHSAIIGMVDVLYTCEDSDSGWAEPGAVHWELENPRALAEPVLNVKGKLNVWRWTAE